MHQSYYQIVGVDATATFQQIKKAYFARAKQCHPDLFQGAAAKEAEFKVLVNAFDVLSDTLKRRRYDAELAAANPTPAANVVYYANEDGAIMDSFADDILEELIVGNYVPKHATLQTLMRDLESTEKFLLFREAKDCYYRRRYRDAYRLFGDCVARSPSNILYLYFLGCAAEQLRYHGKAMRQYRRCVAIGAARRPPQYLRHIRHQIHRLHGKRGLVGKVVAWLSPPDRDPVVDAEQEMIDEMNRSVRRLLRERPARDRLAGPSKRRPQRRLGAPKDDHK